MASINCSECGHEIPEKASSCPNCGAPVEARSTAPAEAGPSVAPPAVPAAAAPSTPPASSSSLPKVRNVVLLLIAILAIIGCVSVLLWQGRKGTDTGGRGAAKQEELKTDEYKSTAPEPPVETPNRPAPMLPTPERCPVPENACERDPGPSRSAYNDFTERDWAEYVDGVVSLHKEKKYAEEVCTVQRMLDWPNANFSATQKGQLHYQAAAAWKALNCAVNACDEIKASLDVRPPKGRGFEIACETCGKWGCSECPHCGR